MSARTVSQALSDLCVQCGLCCNGSLFDFVAISETEASACQSMGLSVVEKAGRLGLRLRCGALQGATCTKYEVRPSGCRSFVCALGKQLDAGQVTAEAALAVVREAQARVLALGAKLDPPRTTDVMTHVRIALASPLPAYDDAWMAEARATQRFLTETFHGWN